MVSQPGGKGAQKPCFSRGDGNQLASEGPHHHAPGLRQLWHHAHANAKALFLPQGDSGDHFIAGEARQDASISDGFEPPRLAEDRPLR
jgi:hypothetical protein